MIIGTVEVENLIDQDTVDQELVIDQVETLEDLTQIKDRAEENKFFKKLYAIYKYFI